MASVQLRGRAHLEPHLHRGTHREIEDDPNLTDKRFPGNPTHSYRALPDQIRAMRDGLADLQRRGENTIID